MNYSVALPRRNRKTVFFTLLAAYLISTALFVFLLLRQVSYFPTELLAFTGIIVVIANMVLWHTTWLLYNARLTYSGFFFRLVLALGLLYLFVITPLSAPDEKTHYHASYEITNRLLSVSVPEYADAAYFDFSGFSSHNQVSSAYLRIMRDFFASEAPMYPKQIGILSTIWTLQYPIEYLPQVLGLWLARSLHLNFILTFLLGRLTNLLFYAVCVYYAIKRTPRYKLLFGLCACVPIALQQAASYSYDSFIIGLSFVLIASILKAILETGMLSIRDYLWIVISAVLLAPAKGAYLLIVLAYLLIPSERFSRKSKKWLSFLLLLACCAVFFLMMEIPSLLRILGNAGEKQNARSLSDLLSNPLDTLLLLARSVVDGYRGWILGSVGYQLSGLSVIFPSWVPISFLAILILSATDRIKRFRPTIPARLCFILIYGLIALSFLLAMALSWSDAELRIIVGVQGRYFTPILTLSCLVFAHPPIFKRFHPERLLTYCFVLFSVVTIGYIVCRTAFIL